jgi:methyl-galactoside transport system substrate-binding protein
MKRFIIIVLFMLSACNNQIESVPLFIYDGNDAYIKEFEKKIQSVDQNDFLIKTYVSQNSQIIQNEQIDQVLKEKHPLLIVNPVDRLSEPLASDLASYDKAFYVGADATQSAELQASLIMDLFGNDPKNLNKYDKNHDGIIQTLILKGEQGHQDAEARTKFVIERLTFAGYQVEVLDIVIANWTETLLMV